MLELQASFKIITSILNSRPIYAMWGNRGLGDPYFLSVLTPNLLLTGRVNTEVPVRKYMREGDMVLISYVGKCRPATYRLGVVVSVVVDDDQLVRTVIVEYSLLSDMSVADRLAYKGLTKKRITVAVQRLCLILPVEEREGISSSGGQTGGDPPDLVSEQHSHDHV